MLTESYIPFIKNNFLKVRVTETFHGCPVLFLGSQKKKLEGRAQKVTWPAPFPGLDHLYFSHSWQKLSNLELKVSGNGDSVGFPGSLSQFLYQT